MSISSRLKEERLRLGLSQTAFAELAGATKSAQLKWERGASAPTAPALAAFAQAGADAVYILTGKRAFEQVDAFEENINARLSDIERVLLEPVRSRGPDETPDDAEKRALREVIAELHGILAHDAPGLSASLVERTKALLAIAENPSELSRFRSIDFAQKHERRESEKELLSIWLQGWAYQPDEPVMKLMAMIALEYGVSHRTLVELSQEIAKDIREQDFADGVISHHESAPKGEPEKSTK